MKFAISYDNAGALTVTALDNGLVMIADRNHPNFQHIVKAAEQFGSSFVVPEEERERFRNMFDMTKAVEELFQLTDRVALRGDTLYFDNQPVESVLAQHVIRGVRDGLPKASYLPFVRFWEKVQANPDPHSRENLLRWLMAEEFTITDQGFIVGYKGVQDDMKSLTAGPGRVNGIEYNGKLDNSPGNVVEIDRDYVDHNPRASCSKGLHVGTWGYASDFGSKTLEVWVDPKDVVSVPTDCNGQKMRVCKYTVKRVLNENYSLAVLDTKSTPATHDREDVDDDVEPDECLECGDYWCEGGECMAEDYCPECGYDLDECECDEDDR